MARLVPVSATTVQVSYGFCQFLGPTFCFVGCALMFHFFIYSQYSLLLSFSYRYYILKNPSPKQKSLILFMFLTYIPALLHVICFLFNQADSQLLLQLYLSIYPNDTTITINQITGNNNTRQFTGLFPKFNMFFCPVPVVFSVVFIRWRIVKLLEKTAQHLRKETKALHRQLLTALTLQACLPIFFVIGLFMFGLEASGKSEK
ncbi:unnamed protein product [Caenorhabditis angaria]|uniref:G-protein coupled receptors family 1 profile domain-containing protein n=1 Tax=Caenorhabditis angaria TaxID=860376 RepID=A0A9P1MV91_9PELO|nr:unnamed protein product [Caenorhabditis angaria]